MKYGIEPVFTNVLSSRATDVSDEATGNQYVVRDVEGRGSAGSPKGLPPAARMTITGSSGDVNLRVPPPPGEKGEGTFRAIVDRGRFTHCPICLEPTPSSREHVPQQGLGGKVMTATCEPCNNGLGSRVEPALQDWHDRVLRDVRVTTKLLPGARQMRPLLLRQTDEGVPVLLEGRGRADDQLMAMFDEAVTSGPIDISYRLPDPVAYKLAALKHAYLAACLALREVPMEGKAVEIRAELIAARDAPRRAPLPASPHAKALVLRSTGMAPINWPIAIVDWKAPDGSVLTELLLGGTISVGWPLEPDLLNTAVEVGRDRDAAIQAARTSKRATDRELDSE